MNNAFKTVLFSSALALTGAAATAQDIQPLEGDGTVASQEFVYDEEGVVIGVIVAGVFLAITGGGDGGGDGDNDTAVTPPATAG
jgi:hypothetical protein